MKHVSIIIPEGHFSLVNVEGTYQILSWVNEFRVNNGEEKLFDLNLIGLSKSVTQPNKLFTINPGYTIDEVEKTDLIILPAIHGDFKENLRVNAKLLPWIINQYLEGAEVVSLCIASFFLASTGLLDGRPCSTHWQFANEFKRQFPAALLMDEKIITEADGIYTSGGAYSFTNLLIYLIERHAGRETAIVAAKAFMIDIERNSQSPFIMFAGQKQHKDEAILNAQEFIESNFHKKFTIDELSLQLGIGRRTFERRFKKATSNTIVEYIQRVKIEAAKKQLETGRKTVHEVMYDVGYNDTNAFRDVFKKITGISPIEYRNKYQKINSAASYYS